MKRNEVNPMKTGGENKIKGGELMKYEVKAWIISGLRWIPFENQSN